MNCQEFDSILTDLVREVVQDRTSREAALKHGRECPACAIRLADQRSLTADLSLLASDRVEAPAHLEESLRSSFTARFPAAGNGRPARPWLPWAAAAGLLVAAALSGMYWWNRPVPPAAMVAETPPAIPDGSAQLEEPPAAAASLAPGPAQRLPATGTEPRQGEVSTDFLALTSVADIENLESGRLVRVQLPRTALVSFGLPMNAERLHEPVTADILMGADGVARAIRFVR